MTGDAPVSKLLAEIARDGLVFIGAIFVMACVAWLILHQIPFPDPHWQVGAMSGITTVGAFSITRLLRHYLKN